MTIQINIKNADSREIALVAVKLQKWQDEAMKVMTEGKAART